MAEDVADSSVPEIYESAPPSWLPQASVAADLGYYGFHPPVPHQDEDLLSDANVKGGLCIKPAIPAETYTTKAILAKSLREDGVLSDLDDFMNQIFKRRLDNLPKIPPATFRPPPRVTLNDAKRQAWFADLANPDVPLYKLGKSVPHGAKGHDLLDLLQSNNVAIPRAVWFLRVFGSNETAGMRNKPNYNPMQYSVDWANVVTGYLKKQLADIALPSAPRPGLNIKQTFKGVLSDTDTRERWISRFSYCLDLLRTFYSESMVDHPTFLSWLVQQMNTCNLAQAGFVVRLVDDYLDGLIHSRALVRPLVEACLVKMTEISSSSSKDSLMFLQDGLEYLLRRIFLAAPNTFVNPKLWTAHSETLRHILTESLLEGPDSEAHVEQSAQAVRRVMEQQIRDVELRNDALLLKNLPTLTSGRLRAAVYDVQLLNSITAGTDLSTIPFFDPYVSSTSSEFVHKLDILLSWCVTPFQYGDHRPYAAVTLLWLWREQANARATRRDIDPPDEILQDHLFDWLDSSELAGDEENLPVVSLLFGELVDKELFSYAKYIQRVIARGEPGLSFNEDPGSRHRKFLRSIPLQRSSPALANQRKVTLYGVRAREIPEDDLEKQMRTEIRTVLPELFGEPSTDALPLLSTLQSKLSTLRMTSRYEQTRANQLWLRPIIRRYFSNAPLVSSQEVLKVYCVAVEAMGLIRSYRSILETSLDLLAHATTTEQVIAVTETLRRHADIWSCLNENGRITHALYASHQLWKSQGVPMQSLLSFIQHMDAGRYLDPAARQEVNTEVTHYVQALTSLDDQADVVPPVLPEILLLAQDTDPDAPSVLASSLWYKYRNSYDWAWTVWDNVIASLRQIPLMMPDTPSRHACALRYAKFLFHIDQHLAGGLDSHALRWFLGSGLNEMSALTTEAWGIVLIVLLDLCIHGPLMATTLLQGVVYPGWQYGSTAKSEQQGHSVAVFVHAADRLCQLLLINDDGDSDNMPPTDLLEAQKIRTRRQDVYHEPHFSRLVNNVPTLVFLEHNAFLDAALRQDVKRLRYSICQSKDFRLGTYQNLDAVRAAFEKPLGRETISEALHVPFISAMCLILSDEETNILSDPPAEVKAEGIASLLSPWKLAASAIAMQYLLKQLGESLSCEGTREKSEVQLDRFASRFFCHNLSSDEAEFVAEMTRSTGAVVAGKFFKHGLQRIADVLDDETSFAPADLDTMVQKAGDILKLLNNIRGPLANDPSSFSQIDQSTSDKILKSMFDKLQALQTYLEAQTTSESVLDIEHVTNAAIFLSRLLQFFLLFPNPFRSAEDDTGHKLLGTILRIMLLHGGELITDPNAFPVFLDTAFCIFDEVTVGSKSVTVDLFQHCPSVERQTLPQNMPHSWMDSTLSMLNYLRRDDATANLVYANRDSSGHIVYSTALQNRPWEWIEYLGENLTAEPKDRRKDADEKERPRTNYSVRNNGSISLELFGARLTGEGVVHGCTEEGNAMRMFEDNLASESMYERDWRECRLNVANSTLSAKDDDNSLSIMKVDRIATGHRASPVPSPLSRSSVYTVPSRMSSPAGKLTGSSREPIDVDAPSTSSMASKRTAGTAHLDDDDLVVLSGPTEVDSSKAKRSKGKTTTKAKARKK